MGSLQMAGTETSYRKIIDAAERYLQDKNHTSQDNSVRAKVLVDAIYKLIEEGMLDVNLSERSVFAYISRAANSDESSGIISGGQWGGYWYEPQFESISAEKPTDEAQIEDSKGKQFSFSERNLYPLIELWLDSKGYKTRDISDKKGGGKWGNPDVVGIIRSELLDAKEWELASCEVKLSEQNWEQFIFEAVSHKRFCNRSWYCYRVDNEAGRPLPKGMLYYAERFQIGIVQIALTNDELQQLKLGGTDPLTFINRVQERASAQYEHVPLREQRDLIERLNVNIGFDF